MLYLCLEIMLAFQYVIFTPYSISCVELFTLKNTIEQVSFTVELSYNLNEDLPGVQDYRKWFGYHVEENGGATEMLLNKVCLRLQNLKKL